MRGRNSVHTPYRQQDRFLDQEASCIREKAQLGLSYVFAMQSLFAWPGGKRNLLRPILARIPAHNLYVEGFSGSAKVLFAKEPSKGEVINDLNGDVVNFYRVVKHRPAEIAERMEHELVHPERFRELRNSEQADELDRALAFIYTTWYSYGAKGEHFAAGNLKELLRGQQRRPIDAVRSLLERSTERLRRVRIEQRDCLEMLTRFDSPETFFYLDPPYVHFGDVARYDAFTATQQQKLFATLAKLQGQFLLSFDNCTEVRNLAAEHDFHVEEVTTSYGLGSKTESRRPVTEVFITPASNAELLRAA